MRKALSFWAGLLLLAIGARAQQPTQSPPPLCEPTATHQLQLRTDAPTVAESEIAEYLAAKTRRTKPVKAASAADFVGSFITVSRSYYDRDYDLNLKLTIAESNGQLTINNIMGVDSPLPLIFDAATGTLTLQPQKLFNHVTYGDCSINSIDEVSGRPVMNTTRPITFTLNSDGSISMTPWGVFVMSGQYRGSAFNCFYYTSLHRPNGTFTYKPFATKDVANPDPITNSVVVYQDNDRAFSVANMLGNGISFTVALTGANKGELLPQPVMDDATFGEFFIYGANAKGAMAKTTPITVAATDTGYNFSPWGVYCMRSTSIVAATAQSSYLLTAFRAAAATAGDCPMTGEGTEASPYLVKTPADLRWMSLSTTEGETFKGKYFRLDNDIDFAAEKTIHTIGGANETAFAGTFDGNGKTLKNISYNYHGAKYSGLFGLTSADAVIRNISVSGLDIVSCGINAGGIVAYSNGRVENCHVQGTVEAKAYEVGGVVGFSAGLITGCSFSGTIIGGNDCGGIVGNTTADLSDCHANATIRIDHYVPNTMGTHSSGIVAGVSKGKNSSNMITVSRCYSAGTVYDPQSIEMLGGIVGAAYNTHVKESFNVGRMLTAAGLGANGNSPAAGGILGYLSVGDVANCYNAGAIEAPNTDFAGGIVGYVGGMSGVVHGIYNCYNSGMVVSVSDAPNCALYGKHFASTGMEVKNSCYDVQTTGVEYASENPLSTARLTSGQALQNFDPAVWTFTAGMYPRLKGMDTSAEAILSATPFHLADADNIRKVRKTFTTSTDNGITWRFIDGDGNFTDQSRSLAISGNSVSLKNVYGYETFAAVSSPELVKMFTLRVVPSVFTGQGTEQDPYLINNVSELETLAEAVNTYRQNHRGDYFRLTSDLDFSGNTTFRGIGGNGTGQAFAGTFDGAGHRISNWTLRTVTLTDAGAVDKTASTDFAGFFGITAESSAIRNLIIDKSCQFRTYRAAAPLVGYSQGLVENCVNNADITGYGSYTAGIVGYTEARTRILNCVNTGAIRSFDEYTGGITTDNKGTVESCFNTGSVATTEDLDGVKTKTPRFTAGIAANNTGTVHANINAGNVSGYDYVGGITGQNAQLTDLSGGHVDNNLSYGTVATRLDEPRYMGAVVGRVASYGTLSGNAYDYKLNAVAGADLSDHAGIRGLSTAELTAAQAPAFLQEAGFTFASGSYPVIEALKGNAAVKEAAATVIETPASESILNLDTRAKVNMPAGMTATLAAGKRFTYSAGYVTVALGDTTEASDVLTLASANYTKTLPLRAYKAPFQGAGTEQIPYLLASKEDVLKLIEAVNDKGFTYLDKHFRLTADLDYTDSPFAPIGESAVKSFRGHLDGNGKTISNLKTGDATSSVSTGIGFFGYLGPNSTVKSLHFRNCAVQAYNYAGILAGRMAGSASDITNDGCTVLGDRGYAGGFVGTMLAGSSATKLVNKATVTINSQKYAGGIAGTCLGDLTECGNEAVITCSATGYAGGLTGHLHGAAIRCYNNGDITPAKAASYLGGLTATAEKGTNIEGFVNRGKFTNVAGYTGGVIGQTLATKGLYEEHGIRIADSENHADISGTKSYLGGIIGSAAMGIDIADCVNHGAISSEYTYAGGIAGQLGADATHSSSITGCRNHGAITQSKVQKYMGGIVGQSKANTTIADCINYADVTSAGQMAGGIGGDNSGLVRACVNLGDITGGEYAVGGISGYAGSANQTISCLNYGNIEANKTTTSTKYGTAAGITGYGYGRVDACANFGALKGDKFVGGIAGTTFTGADQMRISNCYNLGRITVPEGVTTVGNIFGQPVVHGAGNYYQSDVNGELATDQTVGALGETKARMLEAPFYKDIFAIHAASYPTPAGLDSIPEARWITATYVLHDGDTENALKKDMRLAVAPGLSWEVDKPAIAEVREGKLHLFKAHEVDILLTARCGDLSKQYSFHITDSSGIAGADADADVVDVEYFTLDGLRLSAPVPGQPCIVRLTRADGTVATRKVLTHAAR